MQFESFKNKHEGDDIYVLCSGKSCDYFDPSFLDGKIKIGINQAYKKYDCNYLIKKEFVSNDAIFKESQDDCLIFYAERHCGGHHKVNPVAQFKLDQKTANRLVKFPHSEFQGHTTDAAGIGRMLKEKRLMSTGSTMSSGIHLAFWMGAKNIILVGHDCCMIEGETNFKGYHNGNTTSNWGGLNNPQSKQSYSQWLGECLKTTRVIQNVLRKNHNVNLISINPFVSLLDVKQKVS